jgi:serine protease Do
MKTLVFSGVLVAAALSAVVIAGPFGSPALAQGRPDQPGDRARAARDFMVLAGRGSEIGVQIAEGKDGGVVVDEVRPDSPAEKAGLKRSDVVVEFDGERVRGTRQFGRLVQETPPGKTVKATIVRDGQRKDVQITPQDGRGARSERGTFDGDVFRYQLPDLEVLRGQLPRGGFNFDFDLPGTLSGRRLGVTADELTDQLAQYFGVKEGVLVTAVTDGSAASRAGVTAGDIITSIDGEPVRSRGDLVRALRDAKHDEVTIGIVRDKKQTTVKATIEAPSRRLLRGARPI